MNHIQNLKVLGEGGFGQVRSVKYKGKQMAVKTMKNTQTALVEIVVMLKTTHSPNLLRTKHVGFD